MLHSQAVRVALDITNDLNHLFANLNLTLKVSLTMLFLTANKDD